MTYATDNRWIDGNAPETAVAAYGARWIDQGSWFDIVPDRQGFAYNDAVDRDELIGYLKSAALHMRCLIAHSDDWQHMIDNARFHAQLRRTGGYVYCEAWLEAP